MMLPKYSEYKQSLSSFSRKIPAHWEEVRLSWVYQIKTDQNHVDEELLSVFLDKGVVSYSSTSQRQVHKPSEDLSKYQLVEPDDFVLNNQQAWRGSVGISNYRGIISPAYYVLTPRRDFNSAFMNYMVRDKAVVDQFVLASKGVGSIQRQIFVPYLKRTVLAIPPREEQDQIARFLDWKTSEMAHFIKEKKVEIRRLRELKKETICRVVTTGTNSGAVLHDSGISWMGSIPEHWEILRAKNLYKKENRPVLPEYETVTCFRDGTVTLRRNRRTTGFTESIQENGYQGVYPGDLVIHVMDAFAGAVGVSDSEGKCTPVYSICSPKRNLNNEYYAYVLRKMAFTGFIQSLYRGIRERSSDFRFDVFAAQYLPVPPRIEQDAIVEYLKRTCGQIEEMIAAIENEISLVHELRVRTISDVVTGKVDVYSVEIPQFEIETEELADEEESEEEFGEEDSESNADSGDEEVDE
ncbi:MAG: restriction endonuclease subunit S [Saccharofermentanales bacterium]